MLGLYIIYKCNTPPPPVAIFYSRITFNSTGVRADPLEELPRSPGTGVPGALPPEDDCLVLSFFFVSLTDDK